MSYITDPKGAQFGLFQSDNNPSDFTMCGQRFNTADGREVVLFQAGSVALAAGKLMQHSAAVADHLNLTVTAFTAANASTGTPAYLTATLGATKANQNAYAGGFVNVREGSGLGQLLRIQQSSNAAASGTITIYLEDAPATALSTSSKIDLIAQPYTGVVINPTTATAAPAGMTLYSVAASVANTYDGTSGALTAVGTPSFGFMLTQGIGSCLNDAGTTIGLGIAPSTNVAGAYMTVAATTNQIGSAYTAGVDTKYNVVEVRL